MAFMRSRVRLPSGPPTPSLRSVVGGPDARREARRLARARRQRLRLRLREGPPALARRRRFRLRLREGPLLALGASGSDSATGRALCSRSAPAVPTPFALLALVSSGSDSAYRNAA